MGRGKGTLEGVDLTLTGWSGRRVLVTGHTGFKGAWLSLWLQHLGAEVFGLSLPPEDSRGIFRQLEPWSGLESQLIDIRDSRKVQDYLRSVQPEVVFHLAAQALVCRGWESPSTTYETNVVGTSNILEASAKQESIQTLVVITTDKVYANQSIPKAFEENDSLGADEPYGASKAAAELVVSAWKTRNTRIPISTARAGNAIGGGDMAPGRLLPDAWRAITSGMDLRLRRPYSVRPWQFVLDPLSGYLLLAQKLLAHPSGFPGAFNFGPRSDSSSTAQEITEKVFGKWGSGNWVTEAEAPFEERPALQLNSSLAAQELGWHPLLDLDEAVDWTMQWWRVDSLGGDLRRLAVDQINSYQQLLAN